MTTKKQKIEQIFPKIILNEKLGKYSTYVIGGPADYFYKAKSTEDLQKIIKFAKENEIPYYVLGGGSNILFDDKGFRGIVIRIETENLEIKNEEISVDAGIKTAKLIQESIKNGFSGLEKWIGLPGTVGGAVRGNAGCNGLETKDILTKALILDPETGETKEVDNKYFKFAYRYSKIKDSNKIVLNATFKLKKQQISPEEIKEITAKTQKSRIEKQPLGASGGSFFKNPSPDKPAGLLIEKAGLKGKKIGKAQISEKHANFIVNLGGASAEDVKVLAKLAKTEVKTKFKIQLKEEVQIVPEKIEILNKKA